MQRRMSGALMDEHDDLVDGVHQDWLVVERVIAQRKTLRRQEYLVKYTHTHMHRHKAAQNIVYCWTV